MEQKTNNKKPSYTIDSDFIGVFDGYISDEMCQQGIELFHKKQEWNDTFSRIDTEDASRLAKEDEACTITEHTADPGNFGLKIIMLNFRTVLDIYLKQTQLLRFLGVNTLHYLPIKIQKTLPSQGFHVWHVEKSYLNNKLYELQSRVLVYTIYLNDVEEGGETEFLFQKKRVKAKKGRVCLFPAHFPYVHRGNPPLSGEKYIITSWLTPLGQERS